MRRRRRRRARDDAIGDGLKPEAGPLRLFNYPDYVNPDVVGGFESKYGVKVEITTFDVDSEAITKLANKSVDVDIFHSAAPNTIDRLILGGLLQPLNHSYLSNFTNVLPSFRDPWYDKGSKYSVPYTVFSTGIGYRADRIDPAEVEAQGWDILWNPEYKGVTSILDDYREGIGMALLRKGVTDVNTTDKALIEQAGKDLSELTGTMNIKVNIEAYKDVPEGSTNLAHTWSGDMLAGAALTTSRRELMRRCSDGGTRATASASSTTTRSCLTAAKNPVLAHLYINYLLDVGVSEQNVAWNGYLPPIVGLDADYLIGQGYVPENLRNAVLTDEHHREGPSFRAAPGRRRSDLDRHVVEVHRRLTSPRTALAERHR